MHIGGLASLMFGVVGVILGAAFVAHDNEEKFLKPGIASLVIGGIGLGVGIPLLIGGRTTFVTVNPR